jgi:DNA-binding response OmpR family regulator
MRVLVVEDAQPLADVVAEGLRDQGLAADIARDGLEAAAKLALTSYDVVILDRDLPGIHGDDLCRVIAERDTRVMVLMLTAADAPGDRVSGLTLGADDYLAKPFSPIELVARVKALLRRAGHTAARDLLVFDGGRLEIDSVRHEVRVDGEPCGVTRSEYDLLSVLAQYAGRAYSRSEIAYRLRGHDFDGDERLIDVHVRNLRRKIEVDPARPRCIETVRGVGYRLGADPV